MFELFKKVSQFDQTDSLKFVYAFADRNELAEEEIAEAQMASMRQVALEEELQDLIAVHLGSAEKFFPIASAMNIC